SFSYSPNAGVETGVDSFTYRASDGQATTDPVTVSIVISARPVEISEIMASNASTLETVVRRSVEEDFSGNTISPDWIELRNLLSEPVDLEGLFLSDDVSNPTKWQFPAGSVIGGNGYLVVMASGENITDPDLDLNGYLHTNFSLDAGGDSVYVSNLDGQPIHAIEMFPEQRVHISYGGATNDSNQLGYFMQPTPGDANSDQLGFIVADTKFSVNRGFFSEAFALEITTATENATIRYTTNGTEPTLQNGLTYSAPINIAETTTVRAAAFLDGAVPTNVDTNTYVFLADVVTQDRQDSLDAGFPTAWRGTSADYGLDDPDQFPLIAGDTSYSVEEATAILQESLKSIPTVSVVMNSDDLFGDQGIYANPTSSGPRWERATSIELIQPDGTEGFQIDAGIRIQGGAFRGFGLTKKKSFRFLFKNEYGDGKLEYPLFGPDAASEFSTLTLRMESNDGWQWDGAGGQPQYARDQFLRNVQRAMGQPASHGTAIHLYLNGRYWGMYNIVERPDSSFAETYLDTEEYNWDGINSGTSINADGDRFRNSRTQSAWRDLRNATSDIRGADTQDEKTQLLLQLQGLNPDGSDDPETPSLLDVNNMIDYLIINYYGHNSDWPFKNYYVGHENDPTSEGFKFFMWDAEWSLFLRSSVTGNNTSDRSGVAEPFQNLRASDEFNLMFADRVQKHLFNGGVFYVDPENPEWDPEHPERNRPAAIYQEYVSVIYDALIAESARWGDQHRSRPYTRDVEWQREYDRIVGQWFTERTGNLLSIFRRGGLFPDVDAATFNQRGGEMADGFQVVLQSAAGQIYYTLDGSDPRKIGGDLSGSARLYSSPFSVADGQTVRVRVLSNGEWSAIDEATFYSPAVPASADSFRLAEVHYNPGPLTSAELAAGFNDKDEFEFVEFVNVSDQIVDLSNVQLLQTTTENQTTGIGFDFASADDTRLAPGERIVVVENEAAFRVRYGDQVRVAGQWAGGLSNNSEHVTVVSGDDVWYIASYDDDWYPSTDGQGRSLEIVDVDTNDFAVWSTAAGWRASSVDGGTPGSAGGVRIVGDSNGDGVFDSGDLVAVFVAGEYEDGIAGNSTFEEGDWNGDGDFSSADLVLAFQEGTYVAEAQAAESTTDQPIRLVDALPGKASLSELGTVDAVFAAQDSKERDSKPTSAQKAGNDREWYLDDEDWLVV
ncbi:MAG: chitobiase/beta-hexosaminidase C-terminal domain-containing protein, partial [Planctomycetales bacterium]|nr:chitobiase/beta-hexosaminidase C-terminal domain-containing protein [Planctomycetales bacterium]